MWRYEFDETGGYDCMTSGFQIFDPNGKHILTVDTFPFLPDDKKPTWDECHARNPEAEAFAKIFCARLNG